MVILCEQYVIFCKDISENVLKVMYRFNKVGYEVWLVGGGVCDLLFGKKLKDFDVIINVMFEQVCKLFCNCCFVGCCFCLVYVMFGLEIIEVVIFCGYYEGNISDCMIF